ncbi:MAG: TolC family protein [Candidatus Delongbacteria bacterium]
MLRWKGASPGRLLALLLAGSWGWMAGPALAAEGSLSLEQALRLGREHSPAVQAADARARGAAQLRWEGLGYLLPKVDLQEVAIRSEQPGEVFGLMMNRREAVMDLIAANSLMFSQGQPYVADLVNPDPMNTYITRVTAEMPLFAGGQIVNRVRQADLMADAQELKSERERRQVDFDVATAWTNLAKAREYRDLLERARATTKAHVEMARDYQDVGFLVASDVLRAEVQLSQMNELVLRAENGAALAQAALNFQLGLDLRTMHKLEATPAQPETGDELGAWTEQALGSRPDLAAARKQLKAGELEEWVAGAAFLPTLGVQAGYDWYDDTAFGTAEGSYSVKAALTFNVFRGGSDRARFARARQEYRAGSQDVARFQEGVRLELQQHWGDLQTARLSQQAAAQALTAGRENLRVVEDRFREGVSRMIDLLDAETALREAEVRELVARYDGHMAGFRLRHAAGQEIVKLEEEMSK